MIANYVPVEFRVNLERIRFHSNSSERYNQLVLERLQRSKFLRRPIRKVSTPGSDQYLVQGSRGIPYETILGKKERRAYCTCPDFQRNLQIAKEKGYDYVMPCKHILRVFAYRRAMRK